MVIRAYNVFDGILDSGLDGELTGVETLHYRKIKEGFGKTLVCIEQLVNSGEAVLTTNGYERKFERRIVVCGYKVFPYTPVPIVRTVPRQKQNDVRDRVVKQIEGDRKIVSVVFWS